MFWWRKVNISFIVKSKKWQGKIPGIEAFSHKVVRQTFAVVHQKIVRGMEINLVLSNDREVQSLNNMYRGKNKPTNVLSFETGDEFLLGDIVMSFDTLAREAKQQGISVKEHYAHLLCHGVLHLLGFDHIEEDEANEMEFFEVKVLEKFGIANPYD